MAEVTPSQVNYTSDGITVNTFMAKPSTATEDNPVPGVVVIQEWWGVNDHMKSIAQRIAADAGYVAVVPDLYARAGGKVTKDPTEAAELMNGLSSQHALRDLNGAVSYLRTQPFVDPAHVGAIGFCMGGSLALTLATHNSDLKGAVVFYGKVPPQETLDYLVCPVLYHHGSKDDWVTPQEVGLLESGLEKFGKPGTVHRYPEAGHAFFNDTRPEAYREEDAKLAWSRSLEFFARYLRGS